MNHLAKHALISALLVTLSFGAHATPDPQSEPSAPATEPATSISPMADGEIRKINKDAGKLTIRHGELGNLGMPPMTMVFLVNDPAMLEKVKVGDKIRFVADKVGGRFTVVKLEVAN